MENKPHTFYFHYNKPASLKAGSPRMTVYFKGICHVVNSIICDVPIRSRNRKQQPRCVMAGAANEVTVNDEGQAIIK